MTPLPKREYLRQLVEGKNRWFRPLAEEEKALGFLGWHERGYLPHCDFPGLVQFVTFRLADSMPASRRQEWEHLLAIDDVREKRTRLEEYLDRGHGACQLREPRIAREVEKSLLHFEQQRYQILAWCVMPNHVHVLLHVWQTPLWKLVRSWKRHVATIAGAQQQERRSPTRREDHQSTKAPGRRPALRVPPDSPLRWQREYWDTYMRDEEQERTAIRYIENNPVKSRYCVFGRDWAFSSARFRDEYRRLVVPPGSEPAGKYT
jgi:putative transposase